MPKTQGIEIDDPAPETIAAHPTYVNVLRLLWRRRRFVLATTVVGLVLAILVAFLLPKEYISTAELMPPDPRSMAGARTLAGFESGGAAAAATLRSPNALFIGILNSRTIQDDLVKQFDLRRVYRVSGDAAARSKLARRTTINDDRETGVLTITVVDSDPSRARDLNAAYLADLDKLILRMSTSTARRERMFLEDRLKSVKDNLDATEHALSIYSSRSATVSPDAQERAALQNITNVQAELIASEVELHSLEANYDASNLRVRTAQARVAELRSQLKSLSGPDKSNSLSSGDAQSLPTMRTLPLLGSTFSDLYRNASLQGALYEMLTKQYESAKVEEAKEIPTVKVLDPPDLPAKKSFPPRTLIVVAGAVLAFALANCWIFGMAVWNVIDDGDPRKELVSEIGEDIHRILPWGNRSLRHDSNSVAS